LKGKIGLYFDWLKIEVEFEDREELEWLFEKIEELLSKSIKEAKPSEETELRRKQAELQLELLRKREKQ